MTFNSPFPRISTAVCPIKSQKDFPTLLTLSPCYTQSSPCHSAQAAGQVLGEQYQIHHTSVILADIKAHGQLLKVKARLVSSNFLCIYGDANCSTVNLETTNSHALLSSSAHTHAFTHTGAKYQPGFLHPLWLLPFPVPQICCVYSNLSDLINNEAPWHTRFQKSFFFPSILPAFSQSLTPQLFQTVAQKHLPWLVCQYPRSWPNA